MKKGFLLLPAVYLFFAIAVLAQQSKIDGRLVSSQGGSIPGTLVSCGGGQRTTDSRGNFTIYFEIGPGRPVQCDIRKSGWAVYSPPGGGLTTQDLSKTFDPRPLRIAPRGSNLFLSDSALSDLADKFPIENAKLRGENAALKGQLQSTKQIAAKRLAELNKFEPVKKFAQENGLPVQKVVDSLVGWARLTKSTDDKLRQIRSAYILGDIDTVIRLTRENDADAEKGFDKASREYLAGSRAFISNKKFQGSAYHDKGEYREALKSYKEVFERNFWKEVLEEDLAEIEFLAADAKYELGMRIEAEEALSLLFESSAHYQKLLTYYTREKLPSYWAVTQNNLGNVLNNIGERLEGEAGVRALRESEKAFRQVLDVFTRQSSPHDWATTQNNLSVVLRSIGSRLEMKAGNDSLRESEKACRLALEVFTRQSSAQNWAATQNNLGIALRYLGERSEGAVGIETLRESEKAYRQALEVFTRQSAAQAWAKTQNNLGLVLSTLGLRLRGEGGVYVLRESVKAFRQALEVFTRQSSAQNWAMTQTNLGIVLRYLGERLEGEAGVNALRESEKASRQALEVFTRQSSAQNWAMTQYNLGMMLSSLGVRVNGDVGFDTLRESEKAYRQALEVFTRQSSAQNWAAAQTNLGTVLGVIGVRLKGEAGIRTLRESEKAYRQALEVFTRQNSVEDWARLNLSIGLNCINIAARTNSPEKFEELKEGVAAFENLLLVVAKESSSERWAYIKSILAVIYIELNDFRNSAAIYAELLIATPDNRDAYERLGNIYHETLFDYASAFELHKNWLANHPEDISAQADFAENHFTTGRFMEGGIQINKLLTNSEVPASSKAALRVIEIASLLATGKKKKINEKLEILIAEVSKEPKEFKVGWSFNGSRNYIGQSKELAKYKSWLEKLFDAIKSHDRDAIIAALTQVKEEFKK
jgi:tetratricopeptide (TPR) repeat protein